MAQAGGSMERVDCTVIGAGVVGLACAAELIQRGREVLILEAADSWGQGISSRNSEVIHAGIYYAPDTLKARLCVTGNRELQRFAREHHVPWRALGKWLIATEERQVAALVRLRQRAAANGVTLDWVSAEMRQHEEPSLRAVAALNSPRSAIIDTHGLMQALLAQAEAGGAVLLPRHRVVDGRGVAGAWHLRIDADGEELALCAGHVVNAAGPWAHAVAGLPAGPSLHFARGRYFAYHGEVPFQRLIYPLPSAAGLGIHLCRDMAGRARFGPDVSWVDSADEVAVDAGCRDDFASRIRPWWPDLETGRLQPDYAGVRPKLVGPGEPPADFCVRGPDQHGKPGLVQLFGIESPGLTSALPLARLVADLLLND